MSQSAYEAFGISPAVYRLSEEALDEIQPVFSQIEERCEINQLRVIKAFQKARLSEASFCGSTGYGYGDLGREQIEDVYSSVFGADSALVRIQISSGTKALALCLFALLRPGDELLSVTGPPYDTLQTVIGLSKNDDCPAFGTLRDYGIAYREVSLQPDGAPDLIGIKKALTPQTSVILIQKSRGYSLRRSLVADDIRAICQAVRDAGSQAVIFVDNCYGEFVETKEPCMMGADLCAGSLIKNPGGGICPSGGYIIGRADLVERVAEQLNAPGLGRHVGPTLGFNRLIAQGLYLAPHIVSESLKGAVFAASFFKLVGFSTFPDPFASRGDIVQTIELGTAERLITFCQAIQASSPVDSFVCPEPWAMPGYRDPVIMAAGTFIQGASIELSADGPLRPPYPAYLQGGLCFENVRLACMQAVEKMGVNLR